MLHVIHAEEMGYGSELAHFAGVTESGSCPEEGTNRKPAVMHVPDAMVLAKWVIANAGDVMVPECILLRTKIREYGQHNGLRPLQQGHNNGNVVVVTWQSTRHPQALPECRDIIPRNRCEGDLENLHGKQVKVFYGLVCGH